MRVLFNVIFISIVSIIQAQSYVDSGIQKYHSSQFKESITLLDKGYELRDALPNGSMAKIFLYRGLSKFELLKKNGEKPEEGITLKEVYSDIENSLKYGNEWASKVEETQKELSEMLIEYADNSGKLSSRENDFTQKITLINDRIEYLNMAVKLKESSNGNLLLGQSYKEIGDLYFAAQNLATMKIAQENYVEALKYFEIARYDDPFSKKIIEDLLEISNRLDDQARVQEYEKLLKLAGG